MCTILPISALQVLIQQKGDDFIIEYLSQMFYHHQHAVMMSKDILRTTDNENIIQEANKIIDSQTQEMEMMKNWLNRWYGLEPNKKSQALVDSDMCLMNMNDPMSDNDFLTGMIVHHQIANNMSLLLLQRILEKGKGIPLRELARGILKDQSDQIDQLIRILKNPYWQ